MEKKNSKRQNAQAKEGENRCIWMTAGVISFKLCPLNFECENCDFDKAMRSEASSKKTGSRLKKERPLSSVPSEKKPESVGEGNRPAIFFTYSVSEFDQGLYLHPDHLWAREIEKGKWRIGVDELLAYIMPPPAKLEVYELSKGLYQEQVFGKVLTPAGAVFLTAPLSGQLLQTNTRLLRSPEIMQQEPYGDGWLAVIEWSQNPSELERFYTGKGAERLLEEEAQHLKFFLRHRGVEVDQTEETLHDGGARIKHLNQVLPSQVCLRLAQELLITGKQGW